MQPLNGSTKRWVAVVLLLVQILHVIAEYLDAGPGQPTPLP